MINPQEFTCYAGCVTRDLFNFIHNDSEGTNKPALSLGFANISSMYLPPINLDLEGFKESKYMSRNIEYDLTKAVPQKIDLSDSEWFIFDIINERVPVMEFEICKYDGSVNIGYATKTPEFVNLWYYLLERKIYKSMRKIRDYYFDELFSDLDYEKHLNLFCDAIEKKFGQDKIIFNEVYLNKYYIDKNLNFKEFDSGDGYKIILRHNKIDEANAFLKKVSSIIKKRLPNIWVINKPEYSMSDSRHWLGLHPLHINELYYEYLVNAVDVIVDKGLPYDEKRGKLVNLKNFTEKSYKLAFDIAMVQLKDHNNWVKETALREKWQTYSRTFKKLLDNDIISYTSAGVKLSDVLIGNGYRRIAIYGNTEITKVLLRLLRNSTVSVSYIIENTLCEGYVTYPRNIKKYPDTDILLVADVAFYKVISDKLAKYNLGFPIVNAADFLQKII